MHFASSDLLVGCAVKAQFADTETRIISACLVVGSFDANRWTEDATSHRAMRVEIAGSGGRIKRRTRFVIGEVFELALGTLAFAEKSGSEFAGEVESDSCYRLFRALENS